MRVIVFSYQIDNPTVQVRASKPVYINHLTGFGGELGAGGPACR